MGRWWSYFLFLIWLSYLFICGILLFTRGFLLSRQALLNNSTCSEEEKCMDFGNFENNNVTKMNYLHIDCLDWDQIRLMQISDYEYACKNSKHRIIVVMIDALKYDFALYNSSIKAVDRLPFQNRMPIFHELLQAVPNNARLFKFIANPPTTTLQRLKGLTTGSLPTFIDAGNNFGTPEIDEDNILNQIIKQGKHIVLMGDDTWVSMFPNKSLREYPYPSFNIPDLDTVDIAVSRHLKHEIYEKDWSLLVAHFLGVDHCGHTFGPNHPEMTRKLTEMNNVIRDLVDTIDDDTLLFVMGDHGMTGTGDHGGDSEDEVTAALFVYSPLPMLPPELTDRQTSIYQVDMVPTLAFLLGTAIPFSNLGKVALELLPQPSVDPADSVPYAMEALVVNIEQIMLYINTYSRQSHLFSKEKISSIVAKFHDLRDGLDHVRDLKSFNVFRTKSLRFLTFIRELFEEIWVQFDSFLMSRGLVLTFLILTFSFIIVEGIPGDDFVSVIEGGFLWYAYTALFLCAMCSAGLQFFEYVEDGFLLTCVSTLTLAVFMMAVLVVQNWTCISSLILQTYKIRSWFDFLPRIIYIFSLLLFFSNSFVVEEGQVLLFLVLTTIWFTVASVIHIGEQQSSVGKPKKENKSLASRLLSQPKVRAVIFAVIFAVFLRLSFFYWRCREEQRWCYYGPNETRKFGRGGVATLAIVALLGLFTTAVRMWLRGCGNLVGFSPAVTFARYSPTVIVVCIGGYWVWPRDSRNVQLLTWQQLLLPWAVFAFLGFGVITIIIQPLCVYVVEKKTEFMSVYGRENIIPQLFHQVKEVMSKSTGKSRLQNDAPVVYGLATAYSAAFVVLAAYSCLLGVLLLGDIFAPSIILHFAATCSILFMMAYIRLETSLVTAQLFHVPWHFVITWGLLASYFFYGTGHQPTLSNIQWQAAFVGTNGQISSHILSAFLIGANTFCAHLLAGLTLPLMLIAPFTLFIMLPRWLQLSMEKDTRQLKESMWNELREGELLLYQKEGLMQYAAFKLAASYILFHATRMFACMLAAAFHCRHLMVWKIFAPRFIFEGLAFFVTVGSTLLGLLLLARISSKIDQVITDLLKRRS